MEKHRKSAVAPVLSALAIVLLPLGAYVAGYYFSGDFEDGIPVVPSPPQIIRGYRHAWQRVLFQPAAWVEAKLAGVEVIIDTMPEYGNPCDAQTNLTPKRNSN